MVFPLTILITAIVLAYFSVKMESGKYRKERHNVPGAFSMFVGTLLMFSAFLPYAVYWLLEIKDGKYQKISDGEIVIEKQTTANEKAEIFAALERLESLKEKGVLTEQEFAEQKQNLLAKK